MDDIIGTARLRRKFSRVGPALAAALFSLLLHGCGVPGPVGVSGNLNSLVIYGEDEPLSDLLSCRVTYSMTGLVPQAGGPPVLFVTPLTLKTDLTALLDFSTVLDDEVVIPAGTYSGLTLTLSNPLLAVVDASQNPPAIVSTPAQLTTSNVTVMFDSPLVITRSGNAGVMLDFNLAKSVETDAFGQITGVINPVITARVLTANGPNGFGLWDDLHAVVGFAANGLFSTDVGVGEFDPVLIISVNDQTKYEGVSGLGALQTGYFVDISGLAESNGNLLARTVQGEAVESRDLGRAAFLGLVTSVMRDLQGNPTQFTMVVREQTPELPSVVAEASPVTVNLSASTIFGMVSPDTNFSPLTFAETALAVGEHVSVHGTATPRSIPSVDATAVFLRRQSIEGNFSTLLAAAADQKTGGFRFVPASGLFQGRTITVITSANTNFVGVANLNSLSSAQQVIIKGHLFYETAAGMVSGVPWTPPALVMVAEQVHAR